MGFHLGRICKPLNLQVVFDLACDLHYVFSVRNAIRHGAGQGANHTLGTVHIVRRPGDNSMGGDCMLLPITGKGAAPADAERDSRKAGLLEELKGANYPLTIQWEAKAMIRGEMVSLGHVTCKPTYYEKSGRAVYMGSGKIALLGSSDQTQISTFLPFRVDKSVEAVRAAETESGAVLDRGES